MFGRHIVIWGTALFALSWGSFAQGADSIGRVIAVVGQPSASGPAGNRNLSSGSDVFEDDKVVVTNGNAQILLNDGTRLVVGPASTLVLDRFIMRGTAKADRVAIKALRGTFRFISGRSSKSAYRISTAQATIGIRGTGFDFWTKKKTGAVVLAGAVVLRGQRGGSVNVNSGCQMGEATTTSAGPLSGDAKNDSIRENLPFILDQSSLSRRFRLNTVACRLGPPETGGGNARPVEPRSNRGQRG